MVRNFIISENILRQEACSISGGLTRTLTWTIHEVILSEKREPRDGKRWGIGITHFPPHHHHHHHHPHSKKKKNTTSTANLFQELHQVLFSVEWIVLYPNHHSFIHLLLRGCTQIICSKQLNQMLHLKFKEFFRLYHS